MEQVAGVVQKAACTSETPEPPMNPPDTDVSRRASRKAYGTASSLPQLASAFAFSGATSESKPQSAFRMSGWCLLR